MNIINIRDDWDYLKEYTELCITTWGEPSSYEEFCNRVNKKMERMLSPDYDKLITALGLVDNETLIGFISLFKKDGEERQDLTPWYATMYVKKEFRGKGYSKLLNDTLLKEAKKLGYNKLYLKSDLNNYYEKFGAEYLEDLKSGEKLYSIDLQ